MQTAGPNDLESGFGFQAKSVERKGAVSPLVEESSKARHEKH